MAQKSKRRRSGLERSLFNPYWFVAAGMGLLLATPDPVKNTLCGFACFALALLMTIMSPKR
jgi:hypothetical protein